MGTPPGNLGFETSGAGAGRAQGWILASKAATRLGCAFRATELSGGSDPGAPIAAPNAFGDATWTAHNASVQSDFAAAPDGTMTADRIRDDAVNATHFLDLTTTRNFLIGKTYTFGFFHKASQDPPPLSPRIDFGGGNIIAVVPAAGTALVVDVATPAGPVSRVSAQAIELANGWALISMSFTMGSSVSAKPGIAFMTSATTSAYAGAIHGHLAWGAFLYEGDLLAAEDFENSWQLSAYLLTLIVGVSGTQAVFDDATVTLKSYEAFERAWSNTNYLLEIVGSYAGFGTGLEAFDGFETEWAVGYATTISGGVACLFNTIGPDATNAAFEDFDGGWADGYEVTGPDTVVGIFDGANAENYEDFEEAINDFVYTVDSATDVFTAPAHGQPNGTVLYVVNVGGAFPSPLLKTLGYFVINTAANTLKLSLTAGGAAIDILDGGTGSQIFRADPSRYWYGPDFNPTI